MTPEQIEHLEKTIAESIEKNVNGKIKLIDQKLDAYILSDNAWKLDADPYIKGLANVSGTAKIVIWLAVAVSTIGGAIIMIKKIFQ